ncbi:MAG TPA: hypothetical protein VEB61_02405 [Candidatus Binatia bacterium]|nr:hypothetical protein [Candidatus Binatia bacterium]
MNCSTKKSLAAAGLVIIGLTQMVGDLARLPTIKAIAAATGASPAPKVFSAVKGLETYSTRYFLEWIDESSAAHSLELTPAVYARLRGPYNRRNVYGAVLAYGPVLITDPSAKPMFDAVSRYALCGEAPLLRELGIEPNRVRGQLRIRLEPRPGTELGNLPKILEPPCG